jgi:putative DNA primase/helicase
MTDDNVIEFRLRWRDNLQTNQNGQPLGSLLNVLLALREAPEWQGVIAHNEFSDHVVARHAPPWASGQNQPWQEMVWADHHDLFAREWLHEQRIKATKSDTADAINAVAQERAFHPVREYLEALPKWDGVKRVETLAHAYLGAENSTYHAAVSRCWMIGSVARSFAQVAKLTACPFLKARKAP